MVYNRGVMMPASHVDQDAMAAVIVAMCTKARRLRIARDHQG
jgi:hypothetical protein